MHTITLQIDRTGTSSDHELSPEVKYKVCCQNMPGIDLQIDCDQASFNQHKEMLRTDSNDEQIRQEGITFFQQLMTKIFDDIQPLAIEASKYSDQWLHLRVLTNEKELVQLPFELALTPKGLQGQQIKPWLLNPQQLTTLTREVKQVAAPSYTWPHIPMILFAWADPGKSVPADEHFSALRDVVKELVCPMPNNPEPVADISQMITVLKNASLKSINDAVKKGIDNNKPYTHIHILAHGDKDPFDKIDNYKIILHQNEDANEPYYATGEELAMAILEVDVDTIRKPAILSLMTCDSANTGSVALPVGSLAHQLHESGIPCVFASQFPLSIPGSIKLVSALYSKLLLDGEDPRKALYHTRKAVADKTVHDWASLVAEVRFPFNIDEQLKDYRLKQMLQSLKTSNAWAEHVLKYRNDISPQKFDAVLADVSERLDKSIKDQSKLFAEVTSQDTNNDRYAEHSGLLGSAYKRKAEHLFRLAGMNTELSKSLLEKSDEALVTSRDWYSTGFDKVKMNHWVGIQYLSLRAITNESLKDEENKDFFATIRVMAQDDAKEKNKPMTRIWAWGTLMEIYLLQPLTCPEAEFDAQAIEALPKAKTYVTNIAKAGGSFLGKRGVDPDDIIFAQKSTCSQLERYIFWWPQINKATHIEKLKKMAIELREILPGSDWKTRLALEEKTV